MKIRSVLHILIPLLIGIFLGALITLLSPKGVFVTGFLASTFLATLFLWGAIYIWRRFDRNRMVGIMMAVCFTVQLSLGIAVSLALPAMGYDNDHQNNGYLFRDAYLRDTAAWELANSGQPILNAYRRDFVADQYGGLSSLSALVYRYLSPDAHRPFLILLIASWAYTISIPFFHQAVNLRWGRIANLAGWILVLYPEGIFYSISQMREPFLIAGGGIALWSVIRWKTNKKQSALLFIISMLCLVLISWTMALAIFTALFVFFVLENFADVRTFLKRLPWWGYLISAMAISLILAAVITWFGTSLSWDWVQAQQDSERAELEIARLGEWSRIPFTVIKGSAQVVLPAAIAQPSIALWRGITIYRSFGWYALAPLLIYGAVSALRTKSTTDRRILLWMAFFSIVWILISSARAGGDLWDNPRYRTIFLPWFAILSAYGIQWARENRDPWLVRFLIVEFISLAFFTEWYLARYQFSGLIRLKFWTMVAWIIGLSSLVILGGLYWDYRRRKYPGRLKS